MNGDAFRTHVADVLVPERAPGDVAAGATAPCLPPYSPDFHPIKHAFAKLKAHPRKVAGRTRDGLWGATALISNLHSPVECARCFAAAGYDAT